LNNIGEGVIVADLQGRHILLNRAAQDILGEDLRHSAFTPTEVAGHFEMYLPDQRTPYAAEQLPLAKAIRGESVDQAELFLRSAGRPHGLWLSMTGRPLTDNAGTPRGGVVVFHDATEGRPNQGRTRTPRTRALRENEERLQLFFQYISAPVAMFDRDMRYVSVSQRWLTDFRLGHQDVIGRSHYEVFPEIPERWREIHSRCLQGAVERADEDPFERPDGSVQWIRWEIRPLVH
jgi:PAS domain S-box-containing protein